MRQNDPAEYVHLRARSPVCYGRAPVSIDVPWGVKPSMLNSVRHANRNLEHPSTRKPDSLAFRFKPCESPLHAGRCRPREETSQKTERELAPLQFPEPLFHPRAEVFRGPTMGQSLLDAPALLFPSELVT